MSDSMKKAQSHIAAMLSDVRTAGGEAVAECGNDMVPASEDHSPG